MITFIQPEFFHSDERGTLYQLFHDTWKQVNVSQSHAGSQRGSHYHKRNREAFFIIEGKIDMNLEYKGKVQHISAKKGDFFMLEPEVFHSFSYPEYTVTVAMYDIGIENSDGTFDIYTNKE